MRAKIYRIAFYIIVLISLIIGEEKLSSFSLWVAVSNPELKFFVIMAISLLMIIPYISKLRVVDLLTFLLFIRAFWLIIITIIYVNEFPESWKVNVVAQFMVPFLFFMAKYSEMSEKEIRDFLMKIVLIISVILSLQIYALFADATIIHHTDWNHVKSTISVPLGRSNYLAAYLLICLIYIDRILTSRQWKYFMIVFIIGAIYCTMSDGAYLVTFCYYAYKLLIESRHQRKAKDNKRKGNALPIIVGVVMVGAVVAIVFYKFSDVISGAYNHFLKDTVQAKSIDMFMNGRLDVYEFSIEIIKSHWLTGIGLGTLEGQTTRSHNIFLQLLVSGGVINLMIFCIVFYCVLKRLFSQRKDNGFVSTVFTIILFTLFNSMFEPTYQTLLYDFVMFTFIGFSLNHNVYLKEENHVLQL